MLLTASLGQLAEFKFPAAALSRFPRPRRPRTAAPAQAVARRFHLTVSLLRRPHRTSLNSHSGCPWHPEPGRRAATRSLRLLSYETRIDRDSWPLLLAPSQDRAAALRCRVGRSGPPGILVLNLKAALTRTQADGAPPLAVHQLET